VANRKQQRRKHERARAHGRGVDTAVTEEDAPRERSKPARGRSSQPRGVQPPSVRRVARRAFGIGGLFLLALLYTPLGKHQTLAQKVVFAVWMFAMFILVGLATERWAYRRYLKQQGRQ
jgi:hypothetical protein